MKNDVKLNCNLIQSDLLEYLKQTSKTYTILFPDLYNTNPFNEKDIELIQNIAKLADKSGSIIAFTMCSMGSINPFTNPKHVSHPKYGISDIISVKQNNYKKNRMGRDVAILKILEKTLKDIAIVTYIGVIKSTHLRDPKNGGGTHMGTVLFWIGPIKMNNKMINIIRTNIYQFQNKYIEFCKKNETANFNIQIIGRKRKYNESLL